MPNQDVLRAYPWTEQELRDEGFHYHRQWKKVVMVRELPEEEAPLTITTEWDTLVATAGYMICFKPENTIKDTLYDYTHWPVRDDHFVDLYRPWDRPNWTPTPAEQHLSLLGCQPFFHQVGVWAKKLTRPAFVQSVESPEPVEVPADAWLCVAAMGSAWGSPYSMPDEAFMSRYDRTNPI